MKECKNLEKQVHRNDLDKDSFAHDAAYFDSKDLVKRTISGKIFNDRAYEIARNCKYNVYQRALTSMVYKFLIRKQDWGRV